MVFPEPSTTFTLAASAPCTTWKFVTTFPVPSHTKPEPVPEGTFTSFIVYGLVLVEMRVTCTTDGVTLVNKSSTVRSCCCKALRRVSRSTPIVDLGSPSRSELPIASANTEACSRCTNGRGCRLHRGGGQRGGRRTAPGQAADGGSGRTASSSTMGWWASTSVACRRVSRNRFRGNWGQYAADTGV